MKYSVDEKVIGDYPQIRDCVKEYDDEAPHAIYEFVGCRDKFPTFTPKLDGMKLYGRAKRTDFLSFVYAPSDRFHVMSPKAKEIFGINSKVHLAEASKILNRRTLQNHMENGVTIVDPETTWISTETEIGADTIIYPSCYISGKNKIGSDCKIGPFAHLRGDVILEDGVKVGNFVEVKKSTIHKNTNACHLSYIGDSEIGERVNIGAGTITANYNPLTKVKSKTTLGNDVKIGSNSVLVAPVEIKDGANVGALSVITKNVPEWSLALTRSPLKVVEGWVKRFLNK